MTATPETGSPATGSETAVGAAIRELPKLTLDQVDKTVPPGNEPSLPVIGLRLAIAILALIAAVLVGIGVFAWLTFPTTGQIAGIANDPTKVFDEYQQAHTAWFSTIKDLIQLLVVSLLVPLLATVMGYIFGRHTPARLS
jgi:hypothetical protein